MKNHLSEQVDFMTWHATELDILFPVRPEYIAIEKIGSGSFGEVARAEHMASGKTVAIKRIPRIFDSFAHAKNLLREIHVIAQLGKHPSLVLIHDLLEPTLDH